MTTGRRAFLIGAIVGVGWITILCLLIALNQPPEPGAATVQALAAQVETAIRSGDEAALHAAFAEGAVEDDYAAELFDRLPEDTTSLHARIDSSGDGDGETSKITVSRTGQLEPCLHWSVDVIEDRYFLDPVPLPTICRP